MKKSIKKASAKMKKISAHKPKHARITVLKKETATACKRHIHRKKTIGVLPENNVKAKINSKVREIDKKLDEVWLMVSGYQNIKDPHWGHFGDLARIAGKLNEIC